jgi:hypothetical protein
MRMHQLAASATLITSLGLALAGCSGAPAPVAETIPPVEVELNPECTNLEGAVVTKKNFTSSRTIVCNDMTLERFSEFGAHKAIDSLILSNIPEGGAQVDLGVIESAQTVSLTGDIDDAVLRSIASVKKLEFLAAGTHNKELRSVDMGALEGAEVDILMLSNLDGDYSLLSKSGASNVDLVLDHPLSGERAAQLLAGGAPAYSITANQDTDLDALTNAETTSTLDVRIRTTHEIGEDGSVPLPSVDFAGKKLDSTYSAGVKVHEAVARMEAGDEGGEVGYAVPDAFPKAGPGSLLTFQQLVVPRS